MDRAKTRGDDHGSHDGPAVSIPATAAAERASSPSSMPSARRSCAALSRCGYERVHRPLAAPTWSVRLPEASRFHWVAGTVALVFLWVNGVTNKGVDAYAYWSASTAAPYAIPEGDLGAFLYPPAAVLLTAPLGTSALACLPPTLGHPARAHRGLAHATALVGPRRAGGPAGEFVVANINILLAASLVVATRAPVVWAFPLLTKVTPGVGVLWLVGARRWHDAAMALGITAAIVVVTLLVVPGWWVDWLGRVGEVERRRLVRPRASTYPILYRLPVAALLVVWGGATGRRWTVALAAWLALQASGSLALPVMLPGHPPPAPGSRRVWA